ncbi:hypothetical protein [Paludisphaera mucosa]|uniref:Cell division protein FtsQ n=1 Tax=Paludisphaera mucosa TaxID=3030827 RepID=A0ABT6F631_9BACT|nr:hypothetical protein [Paludisphaera mucosa]MDG3003048.1 hypothetical protein [Paludisphaera mucosa]
MNYRDIPRIVASDGDDDAPEVPSRPRRFEFVRTTGRLDVRRLATACVLTACILAVLAYAGGHAVSSAVAWLHKQPRYQLRFDRIELPVPPPSCFRGGAATFLDRVRRNANEPEVLPVLDVDPDRIGDVFKHFPWVERVESIAFPPRGLVVRLAYRIPVARVQVTAADQVVLDREGCILPQQDIDTERLGRLISIQVHGLTLPDKDRVGKIWRTETAKTPERAAVDRGIVQAAKLAGFFLEPGREAEAVAEPSLQVLAIHDDPKLNRGWFVQTTPGAFILWGRGPGDEQPGEPSAAEKWDMLAKRAQDGGLKPERPRDYWTFGRSGLSYIRAASAANP